MTRTGRIYYQQAPAGILRETDSGYEFVYLPSWLENPQAEPVSLTLPLQREPYLSKTMFPFFDGLIPEGWLLEISVKNWKLDRRDRMGLLLMVCRDPIGAVMVLPGEGL